MKKGAVFAAIVVFAMSSMVSVAAAGEWEIARH